jgi:hypothetical protein
MAIQGEKFTKMSPQNTNNRKFKHFVHSPFTLEHNGVKASADEKGRVVLTQEHSDGTYDEIVCTASLFNKISRMMVVSRKIVYKDEPFHGEVPEDEN